MQQYKFTDTDGCDMFVSVYGNNNDDFPSIVFDTSQTLVNLERDDLYRLYDIIGNFLEKDD